MAVTALLIELVWQRAQIVDSQNEALGFRKDQCGAWIQRSQYGSRISPYGWEIDHIVPGNKGGSGQLSNLRPLHSQNNVASSDDGLCCVVATGGASNVRYQPVRLW